MRWQVLAAFLVTCPAPAQQPVNYLLNHPAIEYMKRPLHDPVAELSRRVEAGKLQLRYDGAQGYLSSVLQALDVPVESQMAVFSKTSVQRLRIDPQHPRVLYFNDSVVVGWVPHGTLEFAALDPQQGIIFYTVDQRDWVYRKRLANSAAAPPLFVRRTDCLSCHVSKVTGGIPGTLLRSVYPWIDGTPLAQFGSFNTDQRTPFDKLWGGWYVTGDSGSAHHMGNSVLTTLKPPANLQLLKTPFDAGIYLSPHSDIVALMVFEHQTRMMNLMIEIGWKTRAGVYQAGTLRRAAHELAEYMLFVDQPPLVSPIHGASGFAEKFAVEGPRDSHGRSLRQFDLKHRLMRYPCSYLIYSDAFDQLPPEAKDAIYREMWDVLSSPRFSPGDRQAIVEILRDTRKGLPDYFVVPAIG